MVGCSTAYNHPVDRRRSSSSFGLSSSSDRPPWGRWSSSSSVGVDSSDQLWLQILVGDHKLDRSNFPSVDRRTDDRVRPDDYHRSKVEVGFRNRLPMVLRPWLERDSYTRSQSPSCPSFASTNQIRAWNELVGFSSLGHDVFFLLPISRS